MKFLTIPSREEVGIALWDGLSSGVLAIAILLLTNSLLSPIALSEAGMKSYNVEVLGLDKKASWDEISSAVNLRSKKAARYALGGANIPNLSMQSKQQHKSWPSLENLDRG